MLFGTLSTQLAQTKSQLLLTEDFLTESSLLSSSLNAQINTLEKRKTKATACCDLITDLKELDTSFRTVQKSLRENDIETASTFFGKVICLVDAIQPRYAIADMTKFTELKSQLLNVLREQFNKARSTDRDKVERVASLFKNIGEQEEGMKLYTSYVMQGSTMKQLDSVIQKMYTQTEGSISDQFAALVRIVCECISQNSETVLQLFDFASLKLFLKTLDTLIKENGTQII